MQVITSIAAQLLNENWPVMHQLEALQNLQPLGL